MNFERNWYVLYIKKGAEKKIVEAITKKGIATFCPLNRIVSLNSIKCKVATVPLFSSYIFVYANTHEQAIVTQVDGVINFLHWLGKPATIKNEEIENLKTFTRESENVTVERVRVNMEGEVSYIEEPNAFREGQAFEIQKRKVKLTLPSMGYVLSAEVRKPNVEVINTSLTSNNIFSNLRLRFSQQ